MTRRCVAPLVALSLLTACGASSPTPEALPEAAQDATDAQAKPRLVVTFVFDQFGADTLAKYLPLLPEDGALRHVADHGAFHSVAYPYAGTYTAPGHTAIATGSVPSEDGVSANKYWDPVKKKAVDCLLDPTSEVLGVPGETASPAEIHAQTVSDALKNATGGKGKVVAISLKDRAAIPMGGHHPDLVLWYESTLGSFTTSTYYAKALPAWLSDWEKAHPIAPYLAPWTPEDPAFLEKLLGPDAAPGEGGLGFGNTFPHDPHATKDANTAFRAVPGSAQMLFDLAREVVAKEDLCTDDIPDYLAVSVSTTDYVGHAFGPDSWEYLDNLRRVDRMLGAFTRELSAKCDAAYLLTSDHGVAPLVEHSQKEHPGVTRHGPELTGQFNAMVEKKLGKGVWVDAFVKPYIHLSDKGLAKRDKVVAILLAGIKTWPSVHVAFDTKDAAALRASSDRVEHAVGLSIDDNRKGDIFIVPAPYYVYDEGGPGDSGTSHGTPWAYDQTIPGIAWGVGVTPSKDATVFSHARVAATASALLGVEAPNGNQEPPLPGVPAPRRDAPVRPFPIDAK